ncbi:MAG TPA: glycosyltransferase family 4 protein [Chloroflexota bacterium]|nr:glycosyltransferase family 4 protein [Chloroflexota bacterium]
MTAGGLVVTCATYALVALVRHWAARFGMLSIPNARSSHSHPIPSGGGLVIVAINLVAWGILPGLGVGGAPIVTVDHVAAFILPALLVAAVSFIDDLGHVSYRIRLIVQLIAAVAFVANFTYWSSLTLPLVGTIVLGSFGIVVSVIWIVGLTNAYNFIDGLDGLAAGQATVAGLGWVLLGVATSHALLAVLGAILAASSLGFLGHNWQPARIFMGDVGSTFLGFSFAALPLIAAQYDPRLALAGVLLVWPAIFDSGFTVLRRLRHREPIFTGHREFLFHRLVRAGWSHSAAALLYIPLPLIGAGLAFSWQYGMRWVHILVLVGIVALCLWLWRFVVRAEQRYERGQRPLRLISLERENQTDGQVDQALIDPAS